MRFIKRLLTFFRLRREKVLFADLDGTIIETRSGATFPVDYDDWKFKDGIIQAIRRYNPTHIFIVSNQGGIEKGLVDEPKWLEKMIRIKHELWWHLPNAKVDFTYCISNDAANAYRKPNTGMLEYFYHDYIGGNDFSKRNALMIGDASGLKGQFSDSDYVCAKRFGIKYTDVDFFIRWSNPCKFCENTDDCKYEKPESERYGCDCDADYTLDKWLID